MYIIGLNASPNKKGNTYYMLSKILDNCQEQGAEVEIINVPEVISTAKWPFCTVCSNPCTGKCYENTLLEKTYNKLRKANGVIIGSPVYFGCVTGQLKAFFDKTRKARKEKYFMNLVGAAVTVGGSKYGGQETTMRAIHDMMMIQGMIIVGDGHEDYDPGHYGVCAQRPSDTDGFADGRTNILAKRIMQVSKAIHDAGLR